ncbi:MULTISPECIES: phenylalanine 4-monooxygenase [unclassified Acinetobacter]|uniref:phenylalanine 4-monooxygenase n=1 Tax=unclassified Acinetobacter TaxID=196816 RepID=UPI0035BAC9E3
MENQDLSTAISNTTAIAHGYTARTADENGYIDYSEQEHQTWQALLTRQQANLGGKACQAYLDGLAKLNLSIDQIPQLSHIDDVLQATTGWRTAPVPALISFSKFFNLLANKSFPVATFIRRPEDFDYIQEPDIFHEIVGHCPLLTHPAFASFTETYGKLGVNATKQERTFLARLYWFTVEFGLMGKTAESYSIYGGGILSSPAETNYALSDVPEHRPFVIEDVLRTPYRIDKLQPIYYVIEDIEQLFELSKIDMMAKVHQAMEKGLFEPHPSLVQH